MFVYARRARHSSVSALFAGQMFCEPCICISACSELGNTLGTHHDKGGIAQEYSVGALGDGVRALEVLT